MTATTMDGSNRYLQEMIKKFDPKGTGTGTGLEVHVDSFPSTVDFYRFGLVLFDLLVQHDIGGNSDMIATATVTMTMNVSDAYNAYLDTLPRSYLSTVMNELTSAFQSVLFVSNNQQQQTFASLNNNDSPTDSPTNSHTDGHTDGHTESESDSVNAARSIAGLCCASSIACQTAYSVELCVSLASSYDAMMQPHHRKEEHELVRTLLLKTLHALWKNGLVPSLEQLIVINDDGDDNIENNNKHNSNKHNNKDEETAMQRAMELVEALIVEDTNTFLGDALQMQLSVAQPGSSFLDSIRTIFQEDTPQRDYLLKMVESSSSNQSNDFVIIDPTATKKLAAPTKKVAAAAVNAQTEIQRRIQQVKAVLPELGEGYIESILSHFGGDVSRTVAALFEPSSSLPSALQLLDPQLPARRQENAMSTTTYHLDDLEARDITKERLADMEREQEAVAYALTTMGITERNATTTITGGGSGDGGADEYNDDYDDQYDGMDAGENLANTGGTYDDVDIDTVRMYNRVARQAEQEQDFWEQSRNTNRRGPTTNTGGGGGQNSTNRNNKKNAPDTESGTKAYRGPNKIKGGRAVDAEGKVLPRQRGGKKGTTQAAATTPTTTTTTNSSNNPKTTNQPHQKAKPQKKSNTNVKQQPTNSNQSKGPSLGGGGGTKKTTNSKQLDAGDQAAPADLTKIQKRRKNDNKAKIGNHNRKKGAQKKAAGGM